MDKKKIGVLVFLVVMAAFGAYWRSHHVSLPQQSEMPQILKEAAGTAAIQTPDMPGRKAIRDSFKQIMDENKAYQAEADRLTEHLSGRMSPNSFVSGEAQEIIAELQQLKELDQRHLTAIQHLPDVFKTNLAAAGVSGGDVDALAAAMAKEINGGVLDQVSRAMDLEIKWVDAAIELYRYTDENRLHISDGGASQLEFDSDEVRAQFLSLSRNLDQLDRARNRAASAFREQQQRNRRSTGLTPQDYGEAK